jgi:hypothetical protein
MLVPMRGQMGSSAVAGIGGEATQEITQQAEIIELLASVESNGDPMVPARTNAQYARFHWQS